MKRIVVGISGASGGMMGVRLLAALRQAGVETHLVVTPGGWRSLARETSLTRGEIEAQASVCYAAEDLDAAIASGTFLTDGMAVCPCSMKTLAGIAGGFSENLLLRAADVTLKEERPLVLVPRESPLSLVHLRNLVAAREAGASIVPPMLCFYAGAQTLEAQMDQVIGKVLARFGLPYARARAWQG